MDDGEDDVGRGDAAILEYEAILEDVPEDVGRDRDTR